ncbi:ly6/PLAUR domain-containing protein 6B [Nilaparvata lugens]|uniref:ly6/PLAUR domain-containing protein 6B n=1 Tax=Nilaparvata lugens TaxID=108931 RepID=UPI00193C9047|nr:ly6/PLAUR domain-containing protein 6B [Nilaparvata lugens]XP_039277070.1 ly6/PLAUR domain-containing protein 6B [Nilaparvata lugens]
MLNGLAGHIISCVLLAGLVHQSSSAPSNNSSSGSSSSSSNKTREREDLSNETSDDSDPGLTCYTCVNVSDNSMCNQFAIDHPCPKGHNFCHTLHIMDSRGASVIVNKKCSDSTECWPHSVGCMHIDTQTVCVSCCDEMYCNVTVPTNQSTAIYSRRRTRPRPTRPPSDHSLGSPSPHPLTWIWLPLGAMVLF